MGRTEPQLPTRTSLILDRIMEDLSNRMGIARFFYDRGLVPTCLQCRIVMVLVDLDASYNGR